MEAAIEGIPSVGFSLYDWSFNADFTIAKQVAHTLTQQMLQTPLPEHTLLNVNIPKRTAADYKGMKICRQAYAKWAEEFDKRIDPRGKDYYWMVGKFINMDRGDDIDIQALADGYTSIVPIKIDFTDFEVKQKLERDWKGIL